MRFVLISEEGSGVRTTMSGVTTLVHKRDEIWK